MDVKLELVVIPAADAGKMNAFYMDNAVFHLDNDYAAGEDFRVVQLTAPQSACSITLPPPGSACSITLMPSAAAARSIQGLHLVVSGVDEARSELAGRGVDVGKIFHFAEGGQRPGPDPARAGHTSFASFSESEGNGWLVQEVKKPEPRT